MIHEDAEVVTQVGTGNAQSPHAGEHKEIPRCNESIADVVGRRRLEERMRWLRA